MESDVHSPICSTYVHTPGLLQVVAGEDRMVRPRSDFACGRLLHAICGGCSGRQLLAQNRGRDPDTTAIMCVCVCVCVCVIIKHIPYHGSIITIRPHQNSSV
jgi:hypothetical protein